MKSPLDNDALIERFAHLALALVGIVFILVLLIFADE